MDLGRWTVFTSHHRRTMILLALVSTFAGVALVIDRPKGTILEWFAAPLLALGGSVFAYVVWPRGIGEARMRDSLAARFLHFVTLRGRLQPVFPAIGVGIILADLAYNILLSATPSLQTEDTIVLLGAATLLGYGFVPPHFSRERDFVLVFFIALNLILVAPLLIARAYYANFEHSVDVYSWVALAPETGAFLNLLGVANTVHPVAGFTAPGITFQPGNTGLQVTVVITTACSGIYSFGIFASAFVSFVGTENERFTPRLWALLGSGLLTAYVANVLRMVVIILVGYYTDTAGTELQNMLVAHSYAGWIIFLGWIAIFWGILLKFLPVDRREDFRAVRASPVRVARCGICASALSHTLPATRCSCGTYYHRACFSGVGRCTKCGRPERVENPPVTGVT